jgi:hypothetical protein
MKINDNGVRVETAYDGMWIEGVWWGGMDAEVLSIIPDEPDPKDIPALDALEEEVGTCAGRLARGLVTICKRFSPTVAVWIMEHEQNGMEDEIVEAGSEDMAGLDREPWE